MRTWIAVRLLIMNSPLPRCATYVAGIETDIPGDIAITSTVRVTRLNLKPDIAANEPSHQTRNFAYSNALLEWATGLFIMPGEMASTQSER